MNKKQIVIVGPCAAESRKQILESAIEIKKRKIKKMRASLWKPRTNPGFEGVGSKGFPWFAEVTNMGITIGTEILLPNQVTKLINGIKRHGGDLSKLFFWLGSRNQNHIIQREIAKKISNKTPGNVKLIIKNQPWKDEEHWLGIINHILSSGIKHDRLILCHRGFFLNNKINSNNFRNIPDFDMAMRVKEKTKLPMIFDPSHIGGSVKNIFRVVKMAVNFNFDGIILEVHPNPSNAYIDAKQHLTFQELDELLFLLR